jgi:hypothetical protein
LAAAWAEHGNTTKEKVLKQLIHREQTKDAHRKIKLLRGKLERNNLTMVTVLDDQHQPIDLAQKLDIERAILRENASKFQQSFHSPFYNASGC